MRRIEAEKGVIKMKYKETVEIGREEAFELCNTELPNKKKEIIIARQIGHPDGDEVIYRENGKYYIAPFNNPLRKEVKNET